MSTGGTAAAQLDRLGALGLGCALTDTLRDVDTFDDAVAVAAAAPDTRFAAALGTFGLPGVPAGLATRGRAVTETMVAASRLRVEDGRVLELDVARWMGATDPVDEKSARPGPGAGARRGMRPRAATSGPCTAAGSPPSGSTSRPPRWPWPAGAAPR